MAPDDVIDPPLDRLFVYGTLMPGRLRWPLLAPFALGHRPAEVAGTIWDSGRGWPVAQLVGPATGAVPGVLVPLDAARLVEALLLLDEVEDTAHDEFARVVVTTTAGDVAWAYHARRLPPGSVRIARWDRTDER